MPTQVISVRADARGNWFVEADDRRVTTTEHGTLQEAERLALQRAGEADDVTVLLVDRYMRSRPLFPERF